MLNGPQRTSDPHAIRYVEGDLIQGKYKLTRPIGKGGMGVVWAAHNVVLSVDVAIKLIHKDTGDADAISRRFLQEARTAAQLAHPAICRVFDYGETHHHDPFIVCELLSGESLGSRLAKHGPMSATHAVQTILPIIDGLSVAHAVGIVHRDVKSDNIFLSRDVVGRVQPKLLDFGVARSIHANKITLDGTLLGTPNYMSPEQARGESDYDFRTDIWSLCVVIYELVTGRTPFEEENYNAVLWQIINAPPKSIVDFGNGDTALWQILQKGLNKNPDDRWHTTRELGSALGRWLSERGLSEDVCGASLRATWSDAHGTRPSLADIASVPRVPSIHSRSPGSNSFRAPPKVVQPRAAHSGDCTLPGVTRTAVRLMGGRRVTPLTVGVVWLCLAVLATWLLWTDGEPGRVEPVLAASIRNATTNVATALPPVVDVEDLALEPRSEGKSARARSSAEATRTPESDAGVAVRSEKPRARNRTLAPASAKRRSQGGVNFGF